MSNKNLLNEAQVRHFMKLASLEPLAPGFVETLTEKAAFDKGQETEVGGKADESPTKGQKLTHSGKGRGEKKGDEAYVNEAEEEEVNEGTEEEIEEVRTGVDPTPNLQSARRGHGRGRGGEDRLEEDEESGEEVRLEEDEEEELHATEDELSDEDHFADEEEEELDDLDADETPARTISVDDFLDALETALETVMDDEVEVTEEPADAELDVELDAGDDDLDIDVEEEPLEESAFREPPSATGAANNHKGAKQHSDHRNKKNSKGALASQGPGLVKEEDDEELEEGVFGKKEKAPSVNDPERIAWEKTKKPAVPDRGEKRRRRRASDITGAGHIGIAGVTREGQDVDELVEQITKRVAARILKSALSKK